MRNIRMPKRAKQDSQLENPGPSLTTLTPTGASLPNSTDSEAPNPSRNEAEINCRLNYPGPSVSTLEDLQSPTEEITEDLQVETRSNEENWSQIQGRRLIDITYFIQQLQTISSHNSLFNCNFTHVSLIGEKRNGLMSKYKFICNLCKKDFIITSEDLSAKHRVNANLAAVTGITSAGIGYSQFEEITACMDIPIFTAATYSKSQDIIYDNWELTAVDSMAAAAKREREAAIEEGKLSKDGVPVIDVYADACWSSRSYGNNYKALSGAAAIVGRRFGEVLFIGIKNKYCLVCARADKKQIASPEHVCFKNYTGSSSGMESEIICQGFESSVEMYNVIYGRLIADGDSATYAKLLARNPYPNHTVRKIECRNHVLRNMCNKLRAVAKDTKYALAHRKTLTDIKIMSMRKVVIASIQKYKSEKEKPEAIRDFRNDVQNSIHHAYGNHERCKDYYCSKEKTTQCNMEIENTTFWFRIQTIIQTVLSKSGSMLEDVDTNAVERFNSVIAKVVGGKRINFSLRRGYRARCNAAVVSYNNPHPRHLLQKKILGQSPRGILKKFEERRLKKRKVNIAHPHKKNRLLKRDNLAQHDYGARSTAPDLTPQELNAAKETFLEELTELTSNKEKIEESTQNQRDSNEWIELRKNMITASNFGLVVKRRESASKAKLVENILYKSNLSNIAAIAHGIDNEHLALKQLAKQEKVKIEPCGLFVDNEYPFIGATPDGLIDQDTIVEIKCPIVAFNSGLEKYVPYLELAEPDEGYHGLIRENETLVEVTPAIRARGPLCSFLILNNKHHGEAPFEIMVIDENEARLRVRFPLNCEKRRNYKFDIAAVGCDGSYSNTVPVHITVTDVNEFAPVFPQSAYVKSVDEGRIYDEIVRVEATDRDCTPRYGDVCKYEILTDRSQPFAIDNYGVIRNTEPLDYEKSHNHILSVVAYDCGMMQSAPVMVTIKVNKPCRAGWKGVAERVDYAPGTGPLSLFPAARLEACSSDERCPGVTRIQAAVTLQASRAGSGCDRDTYAVHSQKTICGMDSKTVDLLPSPGAGNEWAKALKPDSGRDGEQMFEFDGSTTAAAVPTSVLPSSLAGSFSISTWMRHAPPPDHDKHRKEHVLCLADDHKMNRHHYALFVRNCRLILLLRRDFGDGDLNIFRPAEWRWKIPEVCDNEWHHYAVNVRFPNVELFVDGEPYRAVDGKGPEVIDDWPLHPAHGVNTTLVVGACWQGTEGDMKHHLHGWLAGLGVLVHSVQPPSALKCVAHCREGLSLAPDLYLKSVSVEGDGVADVETLLRRVAYGDARAFPTPGRRNVHVATTITCDNGRIIKAKPAESYIMVLQPQTPSILINGTDDAARDYAHFRQGLRVFPELTVRVLAARGNGKEAETQKLDSCVVSVYPALNPDHEALSLRSAAELPLRYDIRAAVTRDGVILTGADSVHNYQQVLREIEYSNKKPAYYLNRVFKLTCSELDGRFTSNEYVQTLTVVHPHMSGEGLARELHPSGVADKMDAVARDKQPGHVHGHAQQPRVFAAHAQRDAHSAELPSARLLDVPSPSNHVALLIGVVACGVLVLLGGVGLARARAPRHTRAARARPPRDEMAWDDSALTITLNPMDEQAATEMGTAAAAELSSDGESCDDSDSDRHDSSDDDEEVMSGKQHKYRNISQLEWDNSTM